MMTPREIILANLEHNNPERPGFTFSGNRINDMVGVGLSASETYKSKSWTEGNMEYHDDEWGNIWYRIVGRSAGGEVFKPALSDWKQLDGLKLPDYDNPKRYENAKEYFSKPNDRFKLFSMPGWIFADSRYLRKMEIYFADLIENREEIERLHKMVTDLLVKAIHLAGGCGAEGIFYCEDLGTQDRLLMSPKMWREIFKPHYIRLTSAAHEHGMKVFMHSCGYNYELIDDLVDAGIDCFQFDQPAAYDLPTLAEKLKKHKVALWSPVDIQKILPTGNRELIEAEAEKMVNLFRGFLIAKNYGDLHGIGVEPEWDMWAYDAILKASGVEVSK
jgi:uroporphyrinogen decarboxylase